MPNWLRYIGTCLLVAGAIGIVYAPVWSSEFNNYDDEQYITGNPYVLGGLTWDGIAWAITADYASNWHPLTWISHMADVELFGLRPGPHHLVNVAFHIFNTLLLLLLLKRMTGAIWRSAFVAGLFALHPLHVESVAWVAERKDVLSAFCFFLTLLAYVEYVRTNGSSSEQVRRGEAAGFFYTLSLAAFALGLMCKPMLVTVPLVLLLLDYWPLGRLERNSAAAIARSQRFGALLREKAPFVLLSTASSVITLLAQKSGHSVASLAHVPLAARLENAVVACAAYLGKMFWPTKLAVLYPLPASWPWWLIAMSTCILAGISAVCLAGRQPWLRMGWLWYLVMLAPVIGIVQVGSQSMADRYTYLPLIGCFVGLVWGGWHLACRCHVPRGPLIGAAAVCLLVLAAASRRQVRYWRNSETLFRHCVAVTSRNYLAETSLGRALAEQDRLAEAEVHFRASLNICTNYVHALNNLAMVLTLQGRIEEALPYAESEIKLRPEKLEVYCALGPALDAQGQTAKAIAVYRLSCRLQPGRAVLFNNLAWILATHPDARFRNGQEAVELAKHACELTQNRAAILVGTLGAAYAEAGRFDDAVKAAELAVRLATEAGQSGLANRNQDLLALYRSGAAYRDSNAAAAFPPVGQRGASVRP